MGRPKKEIRAKRRTDGVYMVSFIEDPGRWHATPSTDEAEALRWAKRNRDRILKRAEASLLFKDLAAGFFEPSGAWHKRMKEKGRVMSARHLSNYAGILRNYLIPLFGEEDPRRFTARQIDDAILETKRKSGAKLASGTKYKIVHTMFEVLQDFAERNIIEHNPLFGVQPYSKKPERARGAMPREILNELFPLSHGEAIRVWGRSLWAALFSVLHDTGMRPGEARRLTWGAIYKDQGAVVIRRAEKAGNSGAGATKTGAVRAGRLSERALQELAIWRMESRFSGDADLVFTLDGEKPISDVAIGQAFKAGLKAIGKEGTSWTPYYLRHSFITYALAALDAREVALLAGNSEAIAKAVYSHPDDLVVLAQTKKARKKLK